MRDQQILQPVCGLLREYTGIICLCLSTRLSFGRRWAVLPRFAIHSPYARYRISTDWLYFQILMSVSTIVRVVMRFVPTQGVAIVVLHWIVRMITSSILTVWSEYSILILGGDFISLIEFTFQSLQTDHQWMRCTWWLVLPTAILILV